MGYTGSAFTAGSTLTAAQMEVLRDSTNNGHCVFTTETARDAAIPLASRVVGMMAYLTAPTSAIVTATGGATAIPAMVQTVWNGSVWVCMTPVGAYTQNAGTSSVNAYSATLGGTPGTNPSVTTVTGATALITFGATLNSSANVALMSVAVSPTGSVSLDAYAIQTSSTSNLTLTNSVVIGGLTAGTNTFTLQYRVNVGAGGPTFQNRTLTVQGIA